MKISIIGTGYVGLVTGVTLAEIGHRVTCIDTDAKKVHRMSNGISPIYEPGLTELMTKNILLKRLSFTTGHQEGLRHADAVYIAVGTPEKPDGSADLSYVEKAALDIAQHISRNTIIVTKSTVPVGTNHRIKKLISDNLKWNVEIEIVSNPEFLKEGSAIHDSFHGDRIVVGADDTAAASVIEAINKPFGIPLFRTDIRSAEMIKYASNAFLATKISFINEISNLCELLDANVEEVAAGMGMDSRIGSQFLKAGIGYGGSCFPKDTKALVQIAGNYEYEFELLKGVINVNKKQQRLLIDKLNRCYESLAGKKIAVLGLAFKPNTDDMREAASIVVIDELISQGAEVVAYDPIAIDNAKTILSPLVTYAYELDEVLYGCDAALVLTEWREVIDIDLNLFKTMKRPLVIDGRNCFPLEKMETEKIEYHSVGRPSVSEAIETANI